MNCFLKWVFLWKHFEKIFLFWKIFQKMSFDIELGSTLSMANRSQRSKRRGFKIAKCYNLFSKCLNELLKSKFNFYFFLIEIFLIVFIFSNYMFGNYFYYFSFFTKKQRISPPRLEIKWIVAGIEHHLIDTKSLIDTKILVDTNILVDTKSLDHNSLGRGNV